MRVAVEYVGGAFRADTNRIWRWPLLRSYGIPAGIMRACIDSCASAVIRISGLAVGGAERLVILRVASVLGWLGPGRGSLSAGSALPKVLLGLTVRPVRPVVKGPV
jgi:hypothetical protein